MGAEAKGIEHCWLSGEQGAPMHSLQLEVERWSARRESGARIAERGRGTEERGGVEKRDEGGGVGAGREARGGNAGNRLGEPKEPRR